MTSPIFSTPTEDAKNVLRLLKARHNVLISGPPATGKSRLLAEIRYWFQQPSTPLFRAVGPSPFPSKETGAAIRDWMPSPERTNRKVFSITFHQGTKYRDFVSGYIPNVKDSSATFKVTCGPIYRAAEHGSAEDGAALIVIDEINRGPAVAVFGDTINAIETDKRRQPDGSEGNMTWRFPVQKEDGDIAEISLPHHLYIVAAMNQADTSVEPLDVAFLRRFEPFQLAPDDKELSSYLGLDGTDLQEMPPTPATAADVYKALLNAWLRINHSIGLARGDEFQIGHGIIMEPGTVPDELTAGLQFALHGWSRLFAHVSEVFFGDTRGLAAAIQAGSTGSPFSLSNIEFADTSVAKLQKSQKIDASNIYLLLKSIADGK